MRAIGILETRGWVAGPHQLLSVEDGMVNGMGYTKYTSELLLDGAFLQLMCCLGVSNRFSEKRCFGGSIIFRGDNSEAIKCMRRIRNERGEEHGRSLGGNNKRWLDDGLEHKSTSFGGTTQSADREMGLEKVPSRGVRWDLKKSDRAREMEAMIEGLRGAISLKEQN